MYTERESHSFLPDISLFIRRIEVFFLSFFLSFLVLTSVYLFLVSVEFIVALITLEAHTHSGRTSLDEGSARRRDLYLTTHNTQRKEKSMPQRNSNPQYRQASGGKPTPSLESAHPEAKIHYRHFS